MEGATGVWLEAGSSRERKICAIRGEMFPLYYHARFCFECEYGFELF